MSYGGASAFRGARRCGAAGCRTQPAGATRTHPAGPVRSRPSRPVAAATNSAPAGLARRRAPTYTLVHLHPGGPIMPALPPLGEPFPRPPDEPLAPECATDDPGYPLWVLHQAT